MKLKDLNKSVFGVAIEKHGRIMTFGVRVFIKIHKYLANSPVWSLNNLKSFVVGSTAVGFFTMHLEKSLFWVQKNAMGLIYHVISSPIGCWLELGGLFALAIVRCLPAQFIPNTIACSLYMIIFFSETKHCYSQNDIRSQLIPFSTIPWLWT